jgi:hypothetical protein
MTTFLERLASRSQGKLPVAEPMAPPAFLAGAALIPDEPSVFASPGREDRTDPKPDIKRPQDWPQGPEETSAMRRELRSIEDETHSPATRRSPETPAQLNERATTLPIQPTPIADRVVHSDRAPIPIRAPIPPAALPASVSRRQDKGEPPAIHVTIGRVEVRARFAPPPPVPEKPRTRPSGLTLDEYLRQRSEGRR